MEQRTLIDGKYEYYAFISYKEEDAEWAKWLQRKLEHYKLPTALRKANPQLPERITPIYEYKSEAGGGRLKEVIREGLASSKYLIVICSPRAINSEWLNNGIRFFIDSGQEESIIPFIIEGKPKADILDEECFPLELRKLTKDRELRGININEMGRDAAAVKVVSRMFDLKFDTLWQRYERERRKKRNRTVLTSIAFVLLAFGIAGYITKQNVDLKAAYEQISHQNAVLDNKNDSIAMSNDIIREANDSITMQKMKLQTAYDDLKAAQNNLEESNRLLSEKNQLLKESRDSILRTNGLLAKANADLKEANIKLITEKNEVLKGQSRYVAKESKSLLENGDGMTAINLLLSVLPDELNNPNRPYVASAELALREAIDSISKPGWVSLGLIEDEERQIEQFAYNCDDNLIVTSSEDGMLRLWDAESLQELASMSGFMSRTEDLGFIGDSCVVAYGMDFIHIWNYRKGEHIDFNHQEVGDNICSVVMPTSDNDMFVINSNGIIKKVDDKGIVTDFCQVGDVSSREDIKDCTIQQDLIAGVRDSNSGSLLFSYDVADGTFIEKEIPYDVSHISFSPDHQKLLLYGDWGDMVICDVKDLSVLQSKTIKSETPDAEEIDFGKVSFITQGAWSEDNDDVYLVWSDGRVSKYPIDLSHEIDCLPYYGLEKQNSSTNMISTRGNKNMIAALIGNDLRIYRNNDHNTEPSDYCLYDGKENTISTAFFSRAGDVVYCTDLASETIHVLDVESHKSIKTLQGRSDPYFYHVISFSPDESILISASTSDMLMGQNNILQTGQKDITMKNKIVVDGILNQDVLSNHPIRLFDTETFNEILFEGYGYMPSISADNKYLISSEDGKIFRYQLDNYNVPDTLDGFLPHFSDDNGIIYTSNTGSTRVDSILVQAFSFQGSELLVSPDMKTCVTETATQIGYWDMTGNRIKIFNFGRNIISSKSFISDSILLVVTQGYGVWENEVFKQSGLGAEPIYWLIDLNSSSLIKKKSIHGRLLGLSEDKKELFIDDWSIKVVSTKDLECTSELYLFDRSGYGEQFPLQISNDKSKILYLNKDNQLMIHQNDDLEALLNKYRPKFHGIEMPSYLKQRYYLE